MPQSYQCLNVCPRDFESESESNRMKSWESAYARGKVGKVWEAAVVKPPLRPGPAKQLALAAWSAQFMLEVSECGPAARDDCAAHCAVANHAGSARARPSATLGLAPRQRRVEAEMRSARGPGRRLPQNKVRVGFGQELEHMLTQLLGGPSCGTRGVLR